MKIITTFLLLALAGCSTVNRTANAANVKSLLTAMGDRGHMTQEDCDQLRKWSHGDRVEPMIQLVDAAVARFPNSQPGLGVELVCLFAFTEAEIQEATARSPEDQSIQQAYEELLRKTRSGTLARQREHVTVIIKEMGIEPRLAPDAHSSRR